MDASKSSASPHCWRCRNEEVTEKVPREYPWYRKALRP